MTIYHSVEGEEWSQSGELSGRLLENRDGSRGPLAEVIFPPTISVVVRDLGFPDLNASPAGYRGSEGSSFTWVDGDYNAPRRLRFTRPSAANPWECWPPRDHDVQLEKPLPFPVAIQYLAYPYLDPPECRVVLMELGPGNVRVSDGNDPLQSIVCPTILQVREIPEPLFEEQVRQREIRLGVAHANLGGPGYSRVYAQLLAAVPFLRD